MANKDQPGMTELDIEGYGGDDPDAQISGRSTKGNQGDTTSYGDRTDGGSTGGTDFGTGAAEAAGRGGDTGKRQKAYNEGHEDTSANAGEGEQFGEWDNSGVGTDLTSRMEMPANPADEGSASGGENPRSAQDAGRASNSTADIPDEVGSIDPRTGLVKGGQEGMEELPGPGQYGGTADDSRS